MARAKIAVQQTNAWLLDFGSSLRAAVGSRVLQQIIGHPHLHPVPCTPPYCANVFAWQGRLLPVMDLALRMGAAAQVPQYLVVAGYREQPGDPVRFGALLLSAPPQVIAVADGQACPLPEQPAAWSELACSCFEHQGEIIPVLHPGRVFSPPPGA